MSEVAEKINIKCPINVHNVAIHKDPFHPDAYVISLPLDSYPSYVWQTLFQQELDSSLEFWDRKAVIVGRDLKLVTTHEALEEKLMWIEKVVAGTNRRLDEYNKRLKVEKETREASETAKESIRKELAKWALGTSARYGTKVDS